MTDLQNLKLYTDHINTCIPFCLYIQTAFTSFDKECTQAHTCYIQCILYIMKGNQVIPDAIQNNLISSWNAHTVTFVLHPAALFFSSFLKPSPSKLNVFTLTVCREVTLKSYHKIYKELPCNRIISILLPTWAFRLHICLHVCSEHYQGHHNAFSSYFSP